MEADDRQVYRIVVDLLALPEQIPALQDALGSALCEAPNDHDGPCRIAWSIHHSSGAQAGIDGAGLTPDEVIAIQTQLAPVPVWPRESVDRSLGVAVSREEHAAPGAR